MVNPIKFFDVNSLIIKPLEFSELIVELKRLSKFKYPYLKKYRVYREILVKNTISPKISLKNICKIPLGVVDMLTSLIWNYSVSLYSNKYEFPSLLNLYLSFEELKAFSCRAMLKTVFNSENMFECSYPGYSEDIKSLFVDCSVFDDVKFLKILNENYFDINVKNNNFSDFSSMEKLYMLYSMAFPLNISGILSCDDFIPYGNDSRELQRLVLINNYIKDEYNNSLKCDKNMIPFFNNINALVEKERNNQSLKYPVRLVIFVEGATEELLLPLFAQKIGLDFAKSGVYIIPAGGKNQVAKLYKEYCDRLNIPVLILFDADAREIAFDLNKELYPKDRIFILKEGEFEDIISKPLIVKAINEFYHLTTHISQADIEGESPMTYKLHLLWKEKGLGEFDKIKFAKLISENINDRNDISPTMCEFVNLINSML